MSFDKLLSDLAQATTDQETLAKALPTDDGKDDQAIQAAAGEGGEGGDKGGEDAAVEGGDKDGKGEMAKSFEVVLPNGEKAEAIDGTAMVKALNERMDTSEGQVLKALEGATTLLKGQAEMIKSLSATVAKQGEMLKAIGGEGRGRKATLVLNEKTGADGKTGVDGKGDGMTGDELMSKAMSAQRAGAIQAKDVSMLENYLNRGTTPPEQLVARIIAGEKK